MLSFNNTQYFFTYINNFEKLFSDKISNLKMLMKLNLIFLFILLIGIYLFSSDLTRPIHLLANSIEGIIKGDYFKELSYSSNIDEFNSISSSFNLMTQEINNKISLLEEQNASKQRFIDNLTHEIRTPLTSIVGYSSLLVNKNITDINIIRDSLQKIYIDAKRIENLTHNMIRLITLSKETLNIEKISLHSLLKEINEIHSIKLLANKINFTIEGNDFNVYTDKFLLLTLISNFVDNSIKAVMTVPEKNIQLNLKDRSLLIKDTGIGIPKKDIDKIFEPFYMVDKSREKTSGGFGLGLSICSNIVEILDIDFSIDSILEKGTTIKLVFKETHGYEA